MESELKNWIEDRIKGRNSIPLNTDNFLATAGFGMLNNKNKQLFDFSITLKQNKAIIKGEWEVIEETISFSNNNWEASKLENLVRNVIQHLQKGGTFRLDSYWSDPYYLINRK